MLTAETKQLRRGKIGGTLMAAIAGVNPWMSPIDAYHVLTGDVEDAADNKATDAGNRLEGVVLDWCEGEIGAEMLRDIYLDGGPRLCANLDGAVVDGDEPAIVDAKTTGITGPRDHQFGEPGTDEVPDRVIVQLHHYFGLSDNREELRHCRFNVGLVPVLIGGEGFRLYRVPRNDDLVKALEDMAGDFINRHVIPGMPPVGTAPSMEILKRIRRVPNSVRPIDPHLFERWDAANLVAKCAQDEAENAKRELIAALGDAEAGEIDGQTACTFFQQTRKSHVVKESTFRVLKRVKAKKGA